MGRQADYSIKEEKEGISLEMARAKLGKDVMTPADYVPLIQEYQGLLVDEKTVKKRVQGICHKSNGLLPPEAFKSGSKGAYRFEPAYNELLLTLVATECFDGRKNDMRVATRSAIYEQLLKNIERLPNETQEIIKSHPSYLNTRLECRLMDHIACEMAANIGVLSCANTLLQNKLMYEFLKTLVNFRRWAEQEDALSSIDRLTASRLLYTPCDAEHAAKRKAFETEKLDEFIICLIALKRAGEEFRFVSPDEVLPVTTLPLANRMFRLSLPLELEEKLQEFENRIFNEPRYQKIVEGVEKVLNLDDTKEAAIYKKFIQILQIEYLRVDISPEDYDRMIRFTENAMMSQKEEILRTLEKVEQRTPGMDEHC